MLSNTNGSTRAGEPVHSSTSLVQLKNTSAHAMKAFVLPATFAGRVRDRRVSSRIFTTCTNLAPRPKQQRQAPPRGVSDPNLRDLAPLDTLFSTSTRAPKQIDSHMECCVVDLLFYVRRARRNCEIIKFIRATVNRSVILCAPCSFVMLPIAVQVS